MDHYNERWPIVKTFEPVGDAAPLGDGAGVLDRMQHAARRMQHAKQNMQHGHAPPTLMSSRPSGPFTADA